MPDLPGTQPSSPQPEPLLISLAETARVTSLCERTITNAAKRGELPLVRIGRRVLVDVADLKKFIDSKKGVRP